MLLSSDSPSLYGALDRRAALQHGDCRLALVIFPRTASQATTRTPRPCPRGTRRSVLSGFRRLSGSSTYRDSTAVTFLDRLGLWVDAGHLPSNSRSG